MNIIRSFGRYPTRKEALEISVRRERLLTKITKFQSQAARLLGPDLFEMLPPQNEELPSWQDMDETEPDTQSLPGPLPTDASSAPHAERLLLGLPSALPTSCQRHPTTAALCAKELSLRRGKANDVLHEIRSAIARKSFQFTSQYRNASSQAMKTRSRTAIDNLSKDIAHSRRLYHLCRSRLVILGMDVDELNTSYRVIENADISISKAVKTPNERGISRDQLSWIWTSHLDALQRQDPNNDMSECKPSVLHLRD